MASITSKDQERSPILLRCRIQAHRRKASERSHNPHRMSARQKKLAQTLEIGETLGRKR